MTPEFWIALADYRLAARRVAALFRDEKPVGKPIAWTRDAVLGRGRVRGERTVDGRICVEADGGATLWIAIEDVVELDGAPPRRAGAAAAHHPV
jgi:hypothetical protein